MRGPFLLAALVATNLLAPAPAARASGSMVVDNAAIVNDGTFQVESWILWQGRSWQFWQLPAAQPVHNLEITAGASASRREDGTYGQDMIIQGKGLFRPLEGHFWGIGLSSGTVLSLDAKNRGIRGTAYINVPLSFSFEDARYLLHLNAGWAFDPAQALPHAATWGLGGEYTPSATVHLVGEVFGSTRLAPAVQGGVRYWIVPDHLNLAGTVGRDAGGMRVTVGLGYYQ